MNKKLISKCCHSEIDDEQGFNVCMECGKSCEVIEEPTPQPIQKEGEKEMKAINGYVPGQPFQPYAPGNPEWEDNKTPTPSLQKEEEEYTDEEMEKAYDKCDGCMSCGWKGSYWEVKSSIERTDNKKYPNEFWAPCSKDEGEDVSDHRGYYIYPEHTPTLSDTFIEEREKIEVIMMNNLPLDNSFEWREKVAKEVIDKVLKSSLQSQRQSILEEIEKKKEKVGKYCKHCGEEIGYDRSQGLYFCGTCPFTASEKKEDLVKMEGSEYNQALEDIKQLLK